MRPDRREMTLRGATRGALVGFAWGISARLSMRFISTEAKVHLGRTPHVVLVPTFVGLMMAVTLATHRRWAMIVGGVAVVPLALAAGALMLPTVVFGALAFGAPEEASDIRRVVLGAPEASVVKGQRARVFTGALRGLAERD